MKKKKIQEKREQIVEEKEKQVFSKELILERNLTPFLRNRLQWLCFLMRSTAPMSFFFFSSRRRHTRLQGDWSSDVCSSDLPGQNAASVPAGGNELRPG